MAGTKLAIPTRRLKSGGRPNCLPHRQQTVEALVILAAFILIASVMILPAQTDWPAYGHDPAGTKYSPLKQITTANLENLHRAWTYHTGETGRQFETTPIVAGGRMYLSTQSGRIVALAPETGAEIWSYDPKGQHAREHRGVSYLP